jgi:transposase-like protein
MPRGQYYPEELREEARRLRREGYSLNEISAQLGPPKNTLTLWVRGIELTPEQRQRLHEREIAATGRNRALAMMAHRQARLDRIDKAQKQAEALLETLDDWCHINQIAAAMLYLAEGAKAETAFAFGNSDPQIIRYWLYLLRTSFTLDEAKFRIQVMCRADQDEAELRQYWMDLTGITRCIKSHIDARTQGKATKRAEYKGVCLVHYYDVSIRRYLDALAHGLMARAVGDAPASTSDSPPTIASAQVSQPRDRLPRA